ncbi:hypothetical protein H2200_004994 [Cladophialophora chaetospira]|uniref:GH16 domain-containing protein n=1 Tax=Cladophialophora chaetospira TaxID=386627 RepID=A0AA39CJ63_9EURO|nr:hypothetical protein H2200_004994 [Cladophialophora chaetospira]
MADGDPTGGFVSYYSQEAAELKGMINASDTAPVYIGSDYTTTIPLTARAGRPSVRISTQRNWTHGLFIGDFNHAPGGVCGTWPAFWTLGPNWPHNGEIDIMEGVNLLQYDASTLHAAPNCTIAGDPRYMTGQLSSTNDCAYYPDDNIGCGVTSKSNTSYGAGFNAVGGGIYAMQWTTEYIRVWIFMRDSIPSDITNKTPNPSSWGLPMANLQGDCIIDQRFQAHGIVLNNAFCGEYAGAPGVWDGSPTHCAAITNYTSCSAFVAAEPEAFQDAYWSINSVRVYQLVDPDNPTANGAPYIASEQPPQSTAPTTASTPVNPTTSLCPTYNFTVIQSGAYKYEIECGYDVGGFDLGPPTSTYSYTNFEGCVGGCSLWNQNNGSSTCAGVTYSIGNNACYWKSYIYSNPARDNFASARMLYYAYPVVADDPRSQTTSSSTGVYVQTLATPNYYVVSNATSTTTLSLISQTPIGNVTNGPGMGGGGVASTTAGSTTVSTANTVTSSQTFGSTTTSESFSDISTTSTTLMLSSSMSSYMTTEVTTESSTSPPASEPSSTLTTSMMTTSAQLSSRDVSFSTSSTTDVSQTTSSTLNPSSNPVSTSAQMTGSPSSVGSPTSAGSSSPTSHVQSSTTALTVTTSQTLTQPSGSMSTTSPTSSLAMSVSSVVSSIMPPPPSSSTTDEEPTSTSPTTEVTSTAATPPSSSEPSSLYTSPPPESSLPISQFVSPFQQPDTTSNAPPVFSTTAVSPESSTSGSYGGGDGVISTSFAAAPSPSTTTIEPSTPAASSTTSSGVLPGPTELTAPNGAQFSFAGCLGPKPNTPFANSFILTEDSPAMSIERCVLDCSAGVYAGLYDTYVLPLFQVFSI